MVSEHAAKAFDSDLQELTRLVAEMGGLAERMVVDSVDALVRRDIGLGQRVHGIDDHAFGKASHFRDQPGQFLQIAVEGLGGMFGNLSNVAVWAFTSVFPLAPWQNVRANRIEAP